MLVATEKMNPMPTWFPSEWSEIAAVQSGSGMAVNYPFGEWQHCDASTTTAAAMNTQRLPLYQTSVGMAYQAHLSPAMSNFSASSVTSDDAKIMSSSSAWEDSASIQDHYRYNLCSAHQDHTSQELTTPMGENDLLASSIASKVAPTIAFPDISFSFSDYSDRASIGMTAATASDTASSFTAESPSFISTDSFMSISPSLSVFPSGLTPIPDQLVDPYLMRTPPLSHIAYQAPITCPQHLEGLGIEDQHCVSQLGSILYDISSPSAVSASDTATSMFSSYPSIGQPKQTTRVSSGSFSSVSSVASSRSSTSSRSSGNSSLTTTTAKPRVQPSSNTNRVSKPSMNSIRSRGSNQTLQRILANGKSPSGGALTERDFVLIQARSCGLSYKDIKAKYGWTDPEPTLRGRMRYLCKPADQRVRSPKWQANDVSLSSYLFLTERSGRTSY
jgi:hypothetical protein